MVGMTRVQLIHKDEGDRGSFSAANDMTAFQQTQAQEQRLASAKPELEQVPDRQIDSDQTQNCCEVQAGQKHQG